MSEWRSIYPGVDAHLNSFLQQPDGGWESFLAEHTIQIRQALDAVLPDNYYALAQKSLQISEIGAEAIRRRTRPDVSVYQRSATPPGTQSTGTATATTAVLPLRDTLADEDDTLTAVGIYQVVGGRVPGKLVTRLELLSPANKPGGDYPQYRVKRLQTLHSGVNLVEVDYLHQTAPIIPQLPSYPRREANATPYYALVSDPHPSVHDGYVALYAVGVDAPLPRLRVPLAPGDAVVLDLQAAYTRTITSVRAFHLLVDLAAPPVNVDAYAPDDRERIRALMG